MRILFVSPFLPWPENLGITLRTRSILSALRKCGEVSCVFFAGRSEIASVPPGKLPKVAAVLTLSDPSSIPLIGRVFRRIAPAAREWSLSYIPWFPRLYRWVSHDLSEIIGPIEAKYDVVFIVQMSTMWRLRWRPAVPTIVDLNDVMHLGLQHALHSEKSLLRKAVTWWHYQVVRRAEISTLRLLSKAFVCSEDDSAAIPSSRVVVLPNVFPDRGQLEREPAVAPSVRLLFVGALVYKPNREAVVFFVDRIFPIIRKSIPEATFWVVGRSAGLTAAWAHTPGVTFLGTVDDIDPIIEASAIEVCPILYGMGTRIKILEALSFGKPVVSTTLGAYGIALDERDGLFRADVPEEFAHKCLELLRSPEHRYKLGVQAKRAVRSRYGQERVDKIVAQVVREVVPGQDGRE